MAGKFTNAEPVYLPAGIFWLARESVGTHSFEMHVPAKVDTRNPILTGAEVWHDVPTPAGDGPVTQRGGCFVRPKDPGVDCVYRRASKGG